MSKKTHGHKQKHFQKPILVVQAVRFCPWQSHVLASGALSEDGYIKLWNAANCKQTGGVQAAPEVFLYHFHLDSNLARVPVIMRQPEPYAQSYALETRQTNRQTDRHRQTGEWHRTTFNKIASSKKEARVCVSNAFVLEDSMFR